MVDPRSAYLSSNSPPDEDADATPPFAQKVECELVLAVSVADAVHPSPRVDFTEAPFHWHTHTYTR